MKPKFILNYLISNEQTKKSASTCCNQFSLMNPHNMENKEASDASDDDDDVIPSSQLINKQSNINLHKCISLGFSEFIHNHVSHTQAAF